MKRWLTDWRSLAMVIAAVLVGLLAALVVTSIADRESALQVAKRATSNEQQARLALNQRINQLLAQASLLQDDAQANAAQLVVLRREVALLQQQVRDLGGQPVVTGSTSGGRTTSSPQPRSSPSAKPAPTATRSPRPSQGPTPKPSPSSTCLPMTRICT